MFRINNPDMPKPSLNKDYCYIELAIDADDKEAFQAWCAANRLTMSEVIRKEIKPFINEGYLIK
jgi:antitoxin component of RelBE/YafQ-DinJ toxin-antitoxin module